MDRHIWSAVNLSVPQQEYVREHQGNVQDALDDLEDDTRYSQVIKATDPKYNPDMPNARELNRQGQNLEKKLKKLVGERK